VGDTATMASWICKKAAFCQLQIGFIYFLKCASLTFQTAGPHSLKTFSFTFDLYLSLKILL
jgi:hypothetical protein